MALILLVRLVFVLPLQEALIRDSLLQANEKTLDQLSIAVIGPMLKRNYSAIYELLDSQLRTESWKRLRLVSDDQKQLYPLEQWNSSIGSDEVLLKQDLYFLDKKIGEIELLIDFSKDLSGLYSSVYWIEIAQIIVVLFGLVFMFAYFRKNIGFPLEQFSRAMTELTKGNFDYPLPHVRYAELDNLISNFKLSRGDIRQYQKKLVHLREDADEANRAKSNFLSHMSHELRTPLNAIIGISEILIADKALTSDLLKKIHTIHASGRHLLSLVDELLDLPKLESGAINVCIESLDVAKIFEDISGIVNKIGEDKGTKIIFNVKRNSINLAADKRRLIQVLFNLVTNAIKYSLAESEISVSYESLPFGVGVITVHNPGVGLTAEEQELIFRPFERLKVHQEAVEGVGIGLTISKMLVEKMNGIIKVKSELGKGVFFTVELPLATAKLQEAIVVDEVSHSTIHAEPLKDDGKTILLVEDDKINQMVIVAQLEQLGYKFIVSDSPEDALHKLVSIKNIDLVLTDIRMPGMSGLELTQYIRNWEKGSKLHHKIVGISANAMQDDITRALDSGMDGYLTKPVRLSDLSAMLSRILTT